MNLKINNYRCTGVVQPHQGRGTQLGYPTANINLDQSVPEGIYAALVYIQSHIYEGAAFIGVAQTFDESTICLEVHILDFNQDIYGHIITVELIKKIRDNQKFSTIEELKTAIKQDISHVRQCLQEYRKKS